MTLADLPLAPRRSPREGALDDDGRDVEREQLEREAEQADEDEDEDEIAQYDD